MSLVIPQASRPNMKDYGIEKTEEGLLSWDWVRTEMTKARNYWICTTRANSYPHAAPVWGVIWEDLLYFGTGASSVKARNMAERPHVVMHLESGEDCVIVEGRPEIVTDIAIGEILAPLYGAKYAPFKPSAEELIKGGLYRILPDTVMAWKETDFPKTASRWNFKP